MNDRAVYPVGTTISSAALSGTGSNPSSWRLLGPLPPWATAELPGTAVVRKVAAAVMPPVASTARRVVRRSMMSLKHGPWEGLVLMSSGSRSASMDMRAPRSGAPGHSVRRQSW